MNGTQQQKNENDFWLEPIKKYGLYAGIIIFLGLIFKFSNLFGDDTNSKSNISAPTTTQTETVTAPPTNEESAPQKTVNEKPKSIMFSPPPFNWSTAEVSEETVKQALKGKVGGAFSIPVTENTIRKIVVNYFGEKNNMVYIVVNPGDFWDEKDFVKKSGGSLLEYSKILGSSESLVEKPSMYFNI